MTEFCKHRETRPELNAFKTHVATVCACQLAPILTLPDILSSMLFLQIMD